MSAEAPARLGKYEIIQALGAGAMGVVYLAYDRAIDRRVAVKTIRKDLQDPSQAQKATARFRQEAMAAGRLTHPGIVAVYDYGEDEETAYIVMEYAPGEDLSRIVQSRSLTLPEVGSLMAQLLDALGYAHAAGVVHRDIKPSNLLVSGRLKITDFGIARIARSNLTQTGAAMGTPAYMAPEQYMGREVDHRADLFASGVLFYELTTGAKPFDGESIEEMAYKVCHVEPAPPSRVRPDLPPSIDVVVARALAKTKEARFAHAAEMAQAIALALSPRTAFAAAATVVATMPPYAAPPVSAPAPQPGNVPLDAVDRVTQALAAYVGPIAKVMVKKAAGEARSYRELCLKVSQRLATEEERARFLKQLGVSS